MEWRDELILTNVLACKRPSKLQLHASMHGHADFGAAITHCRQQLQTHQSTSCRMTSFRCRTHVLEWALGFCGAHRTSCGAVVARRQRAVCVGAQPLACLGMVKGKSTIQLLGADGLLQGNAERLPCVLAALIVVS